MPLPAAQVSTNAGRMARFCFTARRFFPSPPSQLPVRIRTMLSTGAELLNPIGNSV
jgi:hypothetical protein